MKIKIPCLNVTSEQFIKRCGYGETRNREGISYVRRLRGYQFPRFHIYLEKEYLNLHLDQKACCYQGISAHSGEYDTEVVKEEGKRIEGFIKKYEV